MTLVLPGKTNSRVVALPHLAVSITAESDALAAATVANWLDVQGWRTDLGVNRRNQLATEEQWFESYPQFEIDIEADASETLTNVALYACRLAPVTLADDGFTASGADLTASSHAFLTGDGPVRVSSDDTLPAGLAAGTNYFVEKTDANTINLHTTRAGAVAGDADTLVTTTDAGTGNHTIADVQGSKNLDDDTRRFRLCKVGNLNNGDDIVVGAQTSYMERINHSPLDLYYALEATETSAQTVTVRITPVMETEV